MNVADHSDPRVDAYIDALPDWQQAICQQVRDLVHAADPEVAETIKRTVQPYFVLDGNICALLAAKDHVNVFLYDGGIVPDPEGIITGRARQPDGANRGGPPRTRPSTRRRCWRCSGRSSPTTAPAAGENSRRRLTHDQDRPAGFGSPETVIIVSMKPRRRTAEGVTLTHLYEQAVRSSTAPPRRHSSTPRRCDVRLAGQRSQGTGSAGYDRAWASPRSRSRTFLRTAPDRV